MHSKAEFHLAHKRKGGSVGKVQWEVKRGGNASTLAWESNLERWAPFPCMDMMGCIEESLCKAEQKMRAEGIDRALSLTLRWLVKMEILGLAWVGLEDRGH